MTQTLAVEGIIRKTRTFCIPCQKIIPGTLLEKDGDIYMRKDCPVHGVEELLYWQDAKLYYQFKGINNESVDYKFDFNDLRANSHEQFTTTFDLDITSRCNLACPVCFPQANDLEFTEPTAEEVLAGIPDRSGDRTKYRANINLLGGESTMRDDLPEICRIIRRRGYEPRLSTNGILLAEKEGFLDELHASGLRWILLQFDSFQPDVNAVFRGRDLLEMKLQLIKTLHDKGFLVHLSVMTIEGYNDREFDAIVRYCMKWPHIKRLSFYPVAAMGRNAVFPRGASTQTAPLLQTIEEVSGGMLTAQDLVRMKQIWSRAYKLTGKPFFKQRICTIPFILYGTEKRYYCISKFTEPKFALTHPGELAHFVSQIPLLMRFDEGRYSSKILVCNIESFYDTNSIDLDEATNCHQTYITSQGLIPFCMYNSVYRAKMHWQKGDVDFKPDITVSSGTGPNACASC